MQWINDWRPGLYLFYSSLSSAQILVYYFFLLENILLCCFKLFLSDNSSTMDLSWGTGASKKYMVRHMFIICLSWKYILCYFLQLFLSANSLTIEYLGGSMKVDMH